MTHNTTHQIVCFGEILWDILPAGAKPGGAPMNVAYHLRQLGCQPALITRIGNDDYGSQLLTLLAQYGVDTAYIQTDKHHNTGLVYAKPGGQHEMTYDIVYPAAWDYIEWDKTLAQLVQQADYFVYGSLITRNGTSKNTLFRLLEMAKKRVLDINLRSPFYNQAIVEQLLQQVDILKLNESELQLIAGWHHSDKSFADSIQYIQDQFHIPTIIVTRGGEGAVVNVNGYLYEHSGFTVQVADTVGSGDAFLAGYMAQLIQNIPPAEALAFASGLGALIASYEGACPGYQVTEIRQLMQDKNKS